MDTVAVAYRTASANKTAAQCSTFSKFMFTQVAELTEND